MLRNFFDKTINEIKFNSSIEESELQRKSILKKVTENLKKWATSKILYIKSTEKLKKNKASPTSLKIILQSA